MDQIFKKQCCMGPSSHSMLYTSMILQILMNAEMVTEVVSIRAQTPPAASPVPAKVATLSVGMAYLVMVGHFVQVHACNLSYSVPVPLPYDIHLKHVLGCFLP